MLRSTQLKRAQLRGTNAMLSPAASNEYMEEATIHMSAHCKATHFSDIFTLKEIKLKIESKEKKFLEVIHQLSC